MRSQKQIEAGNQEMAEQSPVFLGDVQSKTEKQAIKTPWNSGQEVCHSLLAYPSDSALTVKPL